MNKKFLLTLQFFLASLLFANFALAESARVPENPDNLISGLNYYYYEETVEELSELDGVTADATGYVSNFDISNRDRDFRFAFKFTGYIYVPTSGSYTFYTTSDDGSNLYIGDNLVVNNDQMHESQERYGTISLDAGYHAITVNFFEGHGEEILEVAYSGPSISKIAIPDSVLFRGNEVSEITSYREPDYPQYVTNGMDYLYYHVDTNKIPDFSELTHEGSGYGDNFDISARTRNRKFAFQFYGYIYVPTEGAYTFYTISDDGSELLIGDEQVVDNDGAHAREEESGQIGLKAGYHEITVDFFEISGQEELEVYYEGPGISKTLIPNDVLYRTYEYRSNTYSDCQGEVYKVEGMKDGKNKVYFTDNCIGILRSHQLTTNKKTKPVLYNNNDNIVVLGPSRKRLKLIDSYTGVVKDRAVLNKNKQKKASIKVMDIRSDGKYEIVITTVRPKFSKASLHMVKVKTAKQVFGIKRTVRIDTSEVAAKNTNHDSDNNQIELQNKKNETVQEYFVTKKYNLKLVE